MPVRSLTKRLLVVEILLVGFFVSRLLVASLGAKLNAEKVMKSVQKLRSIPEAIAGWERDGTVTDETAVADVSQLTGSGYNLFVRAYVRPESGDRLYLQICRWLDPLGCYEMRGWTVIKPQTRLLTGEDGRALKAAGVKEAWVQKGDERMAVLFWESDLLGPVATQDDALTEDTGARGRLSKLWGRTRRQVKLFFQKSNIVAKVIYIVRTDDDETRNTVLQFAHEVHRILPSVLR